MKTAGEKDVDCDQGWEWEHMVQRLAEIVDLNNGERALMAVWNRYNTQFVEAWKGLRVYPQLPVASLWSSSEAHG